MMASRAASSSRLWKPLIKEAGCATCWNSWGYNLGESRAITQIYMSLEDFCI